MLKQSIFAAAIVVAAASNASAQLVEWQGSAIITSAADCDQFGFARGDVFNASYRHPRLKSNGPSARISIFGNFFATNLSHPTGDFNNTFQDVNGTFVLGAGGPYAAKLRMLSREPSFINGYTRDVVITATVRNFLRVPGNENCQVGFRMSVMR
jgi:hypothetical protein